jgi:alkylation response protein AidB-like acyl-CoA dehydrogenase
MLDPAQEMGRIIGKRALKFDTKQQKLLSDLADQAAEADGSPAWPARSWDLARQLGALRWCLSTDYGGEGRSAVELLEGYEELAAACLTTCFILSQRDAACRRIRDSQNEFTCREVLPRLARGESFATVGLSHLTTSRQHQKPVLVAQVDGDCFVLNGTMPWVSGAVQADHFVTGAVLEDGRQILTVLPRSLAGIHIDAPLDLMALAGSVTSEIRCENVIVDKKWLLAGPVERVVAQGRGGTGGLETSCLALGLVRAAVRYLQQEAGVRHELQSRVDLLKKEYDDLRTELFRLARGESPAKTQPSHNSGPPPPEPAVALRAQANTLVLRATQIALTAAKGTGFLRHHPAQRWARQALFFLIWSCPRPAAEATLAYLTAGN